MADDGFTSWPSSWNQYLYPEDIASDPGFLGSSSNLPAADESTFTEELTSPLDFLYSGNDLRGSGGDHSTSKAPDIFLPDFRYSPENLQHAADISPDLYTGDPHNVFASPLDIAQGGNDLQTLRGESSTSMAPHTAVAEMDPSLGEFKSDGNAPFAFNDGLLPETLMFPSSFLHGGNDLQTSQSGYSTSMAPLGLSPEPSLPPKNYQYYENVPLAFNDGFLPDKIVSPSSFLHSGSDLQTSRGGGSTSMAPCGMVPELSLSTEESQYDVNVPLVLNDGFPPESFTSPMDFSYSDKAPQVSKGKSSSCIPSQMLFNSLNVAPERFQHNGNILPAFDKVLGPEAFEFGAEYLQSDVSFQGFGNKNSTSVTNQQDQVPPSRTSTAPLNFSYSGSNLQTLNDEGYSSKSFYQDEISPPQAVAFQNNSLDSGNEWQTTGNIFPAPTPVQQDHLLGHALKCIFSGNDFQSLIGVVKRWPSASFLDIRPTIVNSTNPQATPAVRYGVVMPSPWKCLHSQGSGPANLSPFPANVAAIWRKNCKNIRAYPVSPKFAEGWGPHVENIGTDILRKRLVFGSSLGVSLMLNESLSAGVFRHRAMEPNSLTSQPKTMFEERFLVAEMRVFGVAPRK